MLKVKVNSKINLSLDILGKRADGYHLLDMVMSSIDLADIISVEKRSDNQINVKYSTGVYFQNDIAIKAAQMLVNKYGFMGADIFIEKHIPEKSGLGGSSSDASGVIYAMSKLNDNKVEDIKISDITSVGSDVLFMLYGGTRRVKGVGDVISNKIDVSSMSFVLLTDDEGVDTKVSYYNYNYGYERCDNDKLIGYLKENNLNKASKYFYNVLYDSSKNLNKHIDDKIDILHSLGMHAFMTGSGSGVVGFIQEGTNKEELQKLLEEKCQGKYGIFFVNNASSGIEILH